MNTASAAISAPARAGGHFGLPDVTNRNTSLAQRFTDPFLFLSGFFFGGALDHAILAAKHSSRTPYGVKVGVAGNWALAGLDVALAATAWTLHRQRMINDE